MALSSLSFAQTTFQDCPDCPVMVTIDPGSFFMGSPEDEMGRSGDGREGPAHPMTIPYRFAMGRDEVTVEEFRRFVLATAYRTDAERDVEQPGCLTWDIGDGALKWRPGANWRNPGFPQGDRHPVVCVSWTDAQAYVQWISSQSGKAYRLPTEAEWEYAARAGSRESRPWGNDAAEACQQGNVADETPGADGFRWKDGHPCRDGYFYTAPVGSYQSNAFGLNDMIGNVWEWAQDCYRPDAYASGHGDSAVGEFPACPARALRGGSWFSSPQRARPAYRGGYSAASRSNLYGFRLVTNIP